MAQLIQFLLPLQKFSGWAVFVKKKKLKCWRQKAAFLQGEEEEEEEEEEVVVVVGMPSMLGGASGLE